MKASKFLISGMFFWCFAPLPSMAAMYQCAGFVITDNPAGQSDCVEIGVGNPEVDRYYGLGVTKEKWEAKYGAPDGCFDSFGVTQCHYGNPSKIVDFTRDKPIQLIMFDWVPKKSMSEALKAVKAFIPADSKLIKTYTANSGAKVDLFRSKWLEEQWGDDVDASTWHGGKPGEFIVIHHESELTPGRMRGVIIATGNNP